MFKVVIILNCFTEACIHIPLLTSIFTEFQLKHNKYLAFKCYVLKVSRNSELNSHLLIFFFFLFALYQLTYFHWPAAKSNLRINFRKMTIKMTKARRRCHEATPATTTANHKAFIGGYPPHVAAPKKPKTSKDTRLPRPFACLLPLHLSVGNKLLSLIFCA